MITIHPGAAALVVLVSAIVPYLLGSLNFAIIVSRVFAGDDIRRHGSGNAGMTNILRTYGKKCAVLTALGDFFKAVVSIVLARFVVLHVMGIPRDPGYVAALFVLLGHLFPLYFRFKGGKGVMTSLGAILAVNPIVFALLAVVFIPVVFLTRYVSLGSVLGAIAFPIITWLVLTWMGVPALYDTICAAVIGLIVLVMHRSNIKRLLSGTENRFGPPKK